MPIIVENLTHIYNKGLAYETVAVSNVSFEIADGEFVAIIGHTGSGKSTLIQHLNGLLKPTSGKVLIGETDISEKGAKAIETRRKIGMVFQYPEYQLFEDTVYKDVAFGPKNLKLSEAEIDERVKEAMSLVNVDFSEFAERIPFELSGGQKRKIAIAGVLAMRPDVLILDEPTAGLDPRAHADILSMILSMHKKTQCTIILVSHNMDDVAQLAGRVFVMSGGNLVRNASPEIIFTEEEFLRSIGLDIPQAKAFANKLSKKGINLDGNILTTEDLLRAIKQQKEDRGMIND